jgi:hypothetical protein
MQGRAALCPGGVEARRVAAATFPILPHRVSLNDLVRPRPYAPGIFQSGPSRTNRDDLDTNRRSAGCPQADAV